MNSEIREVLDALRKTLPDRSEWRMLNTLPAGFVGEYALDIPVSYRNFLEVADGGTFGSVTLFSAADVTSQQFYADQTPCAPIQLGRDTWFCCGVINDETVFINRAGGSIWYFPDAGVEWWQSSRFEKAAEGFSDFFMHYVAGTKYSAISPLGSDDQWWSLLRASGRVRGDG